MRQLSRFLIIPMIVGLMLISGLAVQADSHAAQEDGAVIMQEDQEPPIMDEQPGNWSTVNNERSEIRLNWDDEHGVDTDALSVQLDGVELNDTAEVWLSVDNYFIWNPQPHVDWPTRLLSIGPHQVWVNVSDDIGNGATYWFNFNVSQDVSYPYISQHIPSNNSVVDTLPFFFRTYWDDNTRVNLTSSTVEIDGQSVGDIDGINPQTYQGYQGNINLPNGDYVVWVNLTDMSSSELSKDYWWTFEVDATDTTPPDVSGMQPTNETTIDYAEPLIAADYTDISGIWTSGRDLKINGYDVSEDVVWNASDMYYAPEQPLDEGDYEVWLNISDNSPAHNKATVWWSFTIEIPDTTPPTILSVEPLPDTTISDNTPNVSCMFYDESGINQAQMQMVNISSGQGIFQTVDFTQDGISYSITEPLPDGYYGVQAQVQDASPNHNQNGIIWYFTINTSGPSPSPGPSDTTAPTIDYLIPADGSIIKFRRPQISANYSDETGIDISSISMEINGLDVTDNALITPTGIYYTPDELLDYGRYTVTVKVSDNSSNTNEATESWSFIIEQSQLASIPYLEEEAEPAPVITFSSSWGILTAFAGLAVVLMPTPKPIKGLGVLLIIIGAALVLVWYYVENGGI